MNLQFVENVKLINQETWQSQLLWSKHRCLLNMNKKFKNSNNAVTWIGVGTAIGAAVFAATKEPVWIAVGVAIGAALSRQKPKNKNEK